jgi:uncharacterized damage-inducible protein DinB
MIKKENAVAADYYHKYIQAAGEDDVLKALKKSTKEFRKFLERIPRKKLHHAYAEGKWTIKEILRHIIDAERVFAYRALAFARKDGTELPSFDENNWALHAQTVHRKWKDLVEEFQAVRKSTELLYDSFNEDQLLSSGTASGNSVNVLALGYIMAGHIRHHMNIIKERYL